MAEFAEIDDQNNVRRVVVAPDDVTDVAAWCKQTFGGGRWVNVSGLAVAIGSNVDPVTRARKPPRPFPSWSWDAAAGVWSPPVPKPKGDGDVWNEATKQWVAASAKPR
jgi:hypothetical protein